MNKLLGQYFTTDKSLLSKVYEFIQNKPKKILEPSLGMGHLVDYVLKQDNSIYFKMIEIDSSLDHLECIQRKDVIYTNFLHYDEKEKYTTIIGNPPYVKKKGGNMYIQFIDKCIDLLKDNGELIFIIPSNFFKMTSSSKTIKKMMKHGYISDIYHPHDEYLFKDASIDILIFRYVKSQHNIKKIRYNNDYKYVFHQNGIVTFENESQKNCIKLKDYFDVYVGMASGCEQVLKNNLFGNHELLIEKDKIEKYIIINDFDNQNEDLKDYLNSYKKLLKLRRIRNIDDNNWYEFGLLRNKSKIDLLKGKSAIYMYSLTRKEQVSFQTNVMYFGGNLLLIIPKEKYENKLDLELLNNYFNSNIFREKYTSSKKFKISHKNLTECAIPKKYLQYK
jgi:adenine-specific DNA-methyltransferase